MGYGQYVVVIGSGLRGVTRVVGPFSYEGTADEWIKNNPPEPGLEALAVPLDTPQS